MVYALRNNMIIVVLVFVFNSLAAQVKPIGLPVVKNYPTDKTGASTHSWDIIQDERGVIYFANDAGILKFDGEEWDLYPVSNRSIVRSLAIDDQNRILVGAYTEIGMLEEDTLGQLHYHSLNHLIPEEYRDFDDVWKIYNTDYGTIFQSFEYIFILQNDSMRVLEPENRFGFSYYVDNKFYVIEKGVGLMVYDGEQLKPVSEDELFTSDEIRFILPWSLQSLLIGSFSGGMYILENGKLAPWDTEINKIANDKKIYSGIFLEDQLMIGTIYDGIYISNKEGKVIQHFNRSTGLQNNTVLSAYRDAQNNLWLGLDNGIDYLKVSLPVSFLNYNMGIETVYASIIHEGRLYVGTNQGLLTKKVDNLGDYRYNDFTIVEGAEGQVWALEVVDGELLCGHNRGAYRIKGTRAVKISDARGVWNFFRLKDNDKVLFSGTYDGIISYHKDSQGHWKQKEKIKGFELSCRKVIADEENNIWISHDHEGLFRLNLSAELDSAVNLQLFNGSHGISGEVPYKIHLMDDLFFVSTTKGCFTYNPKAERFEASAVLNDIFQGLGRINLLKEDDRGNRWYFSEKRIGLFKLLEDGTYVDVFTPFLMLRNILLKDYENIFIHDHKNIFIGTTNGLVHFDASLNKDYFISTSAFIKKVIISNKGRDSVLMHNYSLVNDTVNEYLINYDWNTIHLKYFCPDLENTDNLRYSYRLLGFSDEWSDWSFNNEKEYTNLHEGEYIFEVKAKNVFNNISKTDRFHFEVKAPFYRSKLAYILFIVFLLAGAFVLIFLVRRRISNVRSYEKEKHTAFFLKKEEQLERDRQAAQRELEHLKIEKLEADMKHKSKELVNSTYHIIRKNKILNTVKQELSKLSAQAKSELVEQELRKISQKIDRDINNEKNWEVFDRYFDEVHQEFLTRLKEKHPELSPKELRLSSYLRMNISSKEIAPLLNISIRGVEISRYRLRKKLNLDRNTNLTEYLLNM